MTLDGWTDPAGRPHLERVVRPPMSAVGVAAFSSLRRRVVVDVVARSRSTSGRANDWTRRGPGGTGRETRRRAGADATTGRGREEGDPATRRRFGFGFARAMVPARFARTSSGGDFVESRRRRTRATTRTDRRRTTERLNRGTQRSGSGSGRVGAVSSSSSLSSSSSSSFPAMTGGAVKEEEDSTTTFDSASADVERLGEWLALAGVDHASFAVKNGGTKTLVDLFNECALGESTLTMHVNGETGERTATRTTRVLTARVRRRADVERGDDSKCLIELEQRFDNGRTRSRMRPLSEKMLPGEDWRACATRAVTEELGSALADGFSVVTLDDTYTFCISDRDSASYPGLPTRFALHRVDVIVDGLPDRDEFESVEALPNGRGSLRARWGFRDFAWTGDDLGPA